jgi:antitoxin component HigA of HigAB toxin-antitoxin module
LPVSCSRSRWDPSSGCWATTTCKAIQPTRPDEQSDKAIAVLNGRLARGRPLDDQEQGYLEALGNEIERYEAEAVPVPEVSGADMPRHLMEAHEKTLTGVAKATGIALSTLSEVKDKKRDLTLKHSARLAPDFGVEQAVFLP